MSRREYDFETSDAATSLDPLMKAINEQKANFGGSNYYIELARKFDNSNYQWVIYRSSNNVNCWDVLTSGYFVLFRINKMGTTSATAEVVKSMSFSGLYLSQGLSQCTVTQVSRTSTSVSVYTYIHTYLFVPVSTTRYKTAYLRTYGVDITTLTSSGSIRSTSDIALKNTSTTIGNYINNNSFIYATGTAIQWHNSSNNTIQGPVVVRLTLSSSFAAEPTVSSTVTGPSAGSVTRCQLLIYYNYYRWITWTPNPSGHDTTSSMGWTTNASATGWNKSTTAVSPFAGRYYKCYYFPIWNWTTPTTSSIEQNNKCLWWLTNTDENNSYLERKFMMSSFSSLTPDSSVENQDYYRVWNGYTSSNYPSMFGLMTIDGRIIYTLNLNTKLIEKIDTKVR